MEVCMANLLSAGRREFSLLASSAILLSATACGQGGGNPNGPKMTNVPGAVTASPAGSANLTGHFEIRAFQPGDNFIFSSASIGGACLVGQYPVPPKSCTQHTECPLPPQRATGNGVSSYCLQESPGAPTAGNGGAVPPTGAGTCWVKPSEDFCLTFVGPGQHDTTAADSTAMAAEGVKKWRVLTCLNGVPGACGGAPATPNQLQHQSGTVYTAP
jgi:hypothetical protein